MSRGKIIPPRLTPTINQPVTAPVMVMWRPTKVGIVGKPQAMPSPKTAIQLAPAVRTTERSGHACRPFPRHVDLLDADRQDEPDVVVLRPDGAVPPRPTRRPLGTCRAGHDARVGAPVSCAVHGAVPHGTRGVRQKETACWKDSRRSISSWCW